MGRLLTVLLLLQAASASAQEEPPVPGALPRKVKHYSITMAPIRLISPILEIDLEYRIIDEISFTVLAAGGKTKLEQQATDSPRVAIYEVGGHVSYYLVGDFERGLMVALEGLYVKLDSETQVGQRSGFGVGPLLGYKVALRSGLTFLGQAGVSLYSGEGELDNNVVCDRCVANLNLNVGWSF